MTSITRFAPSPTGHLHLGHAFAARFAAQHGACMLLRLEDIDTTRCRDEFDASIQQDLAWLGLTWPKPVWRQSQRLAAYQQALASLQAAELVYPCFCTRKDILAELEAMQSAPHSVTGREAYPGTCRNLSLAQRQQRLADGQSHAWRLDAGKALETLGHAGRHAALPWFDQARGWQDAALASLEDVVLARKDVPTSYHLSVVIDDAAQGVTLVTRGLDLWDATPVQRLLQALLALPTPQYHHHPLLLGADGKRFAKRDKSLTIRSLRDQGYTPAQVWEQVDACRRWPDQEDPAALCASQLGP